MSLRKRFYEILFPVDAKDQTANFVNTCIQFLIITNIVAVIVESVESIHSTWGKAFEFFEVFSVAIFTVEYFLRLWMAVESSLYKQCWRGRLRAALTPLLLVDLFAVLPFYLPFLGVDLRSMRVLRLFRLFRIMKMARYWKALYLFSKVFKNSREQLYTTFVLFLVFLVLLSSMMYFAEHDTQPQLFSSIPASMWWGIITLTTIGYGDVVPVTYLGKVIGGFAAFSGILVFALLAGVLVKGFLDEVDRDKREKKRRALFRDNYLS